MVISKYVVRPASLARTSIDRIESLPGRENLCALYVYDPSIKRSAIPTPETITGMSFVFTLLITPSSPTPIFKKKKNTLQKIFFYRSQEHNQGTSPVRTPLKRISTPDPSMIIIRDQVVLSSSLYCHFMAYS